MFDTMTMTKIAGSMCGALLIFLLGGWVADGVYSMDAGHGDDHHAQAYEIDTGADDAGGEPDEEVADFATLFASADLDKGEKVFGKCKACHKLEKGANSTGPYLYGVVGREVDAAEGFEAYSGVLEEAAAVWTPEELDGFLENPKGYAPGTKMSFAGLSKPEDRANVIAYLDMTDGDMTEVAMAEASDENPPVINEDSAAEAVTAEDSVITEVEPTPEAEAAADAATPEVAEDAAAEEAVTEEPATEEAAAEEAVTEEAATEEAVTEEAATEEAAVEEAATEEAAADTGASGFAALVAAADVDKGAKVFKKCAACHTLETGKNKVGPYLTGVIGRDIASVDGFKYSDSLTEIEGEWTYDQLDAFLLKPRDFASGTKMSFAGLKKDEDRADVIAYIESAGQ